MSPGDPFPPAEFDPWAASYDEDVTRDDRFPFLGYRHVLDAVMGLAAPQTGMSVLDIGTGTGNLAARFAAAGCELWCTDFSEAMLQKARLKLPSAHIVRHDMREAWPAELDRRFDRIVSAYVFHHLELAKKVELCSELVNERLEANGRLIVADLSFRNQHAMTQFAASAGEAWEQEPYWLVDEALDALRHAGLSPRYTQVSACAGIYEFEA